MVFLCGEVEAALEVFWRVLAPVNFAIVNAIALGCGTKRADEAKLVSIWDVILSSRLLICVIGKCRWRQNDLELSCLLKRAQVMC